MPKENRFKVGPGNPLSTQYNQDVLQTVEKKYRATFKNDVHVSADDIEGTY